MDIPFSRFMQLDITAITSFFYAAWWISQTDMMSHLQTVVWNLTKIIMPNAESAVVMQHYKLLP